MTLYFMFCFLPIEHTHGYAGRNERCEVPIEKDGGIAGAICTSKLVFCKSCEGRHARLVAGRTAAPLIEA
jgi:hypothetical protein